MSSELATTQGTMAAPPSRLSGNWQTIAATVGLVVVVLLFAYFLYRFAAHTNNKLKAVEQAIHTLNERTKHQQQAPLQPPPTLFARHHEAFMPPPPPVVHVAPPPPPPPVVIDAKTLDKELTEELKELSVEVSEGRVDAAAATETKA